MIKPFDRESPSCLRNCPSKGSVGQFLGRQLRHLYTRLLHRSCQIGKVYNSQMATNVNKTHSDSLSTSEKVADFITGKIGTMGCVIFFTVLALVSLPSVIASHSVILWVSWTTQSFLQLVLLPLIMISQNIQSRHSEMRSEEDFNINVKAEKEIKDIQKKLDLIINKLTK